MSCLLVNLRAGLSQYKDNLEFAKHKAQSVHPPNSITALNEIMFKLTMLTDGTVAINMKE